MYQLAMKFLRAGAGSWGGAAAGAAIASASGVGPIGLTGLLGIYSVCLAVETLADAATSDGRISRIEIWLEELVRRHGRLDDALMEIANGQASHELVSSQNAQTLIDIRTASEGQLEVLLEENADAKRLVDSMSGYLSQLGDQVLSKLDQQADLLASLQNSIYAVDVGVRGIRQELDKRIPSEQDLRLRSADDQENCRLRIEKLQELFDLMEWAEVKIFACRCELWLRRVGACLPALDQAQLIERLIEDAAMRVKWADVEMKTPAIVHLQSLIELAEPLVPQLEGEDQLRVSSHLAYSESLVNGPASGLDRLQGRIDPYGLRRRLSILLDNNRYEEAWELIRDEVPAAEWVEKGVMASGRAGQWADAERLLEWAILHAPIRSQRVSRLMFVESALYDGTNDVFGLRSDPPTEVENRLRHCVKILQPLVDGVREYAAPQNGFDCAVLRLSLILAAQLGDIGDMRRSALQLSKHRPLDSVLAYLAIKGRIEDEPGWAQRLRTEGTASFERRHLATLLDSIRPELVDKAFRSALHLAKEASTAEEREQTLALLFQLAQQLGENAQSQVEELVPGLRESGDRRWQLWAISRMFMRGETNEADKQLEILRDVTDPLWLQIHGQRCLQLGEINTGIEELSEAALAINRPDILDEVSSLAMSHSQWESAAKLLERLAALKPADIHTRASWAMVLQKLGEEDNAANLFLLLAQEQPDSLLYWLNAAICLVRAGRPDEAVEAFAKACDLPDPPIQAVTGLAHVLVERDRAVEAFSTLEQHRERFWSEHEFVGTYWSIAFAAEQEAAGHKAFLQMRILQAKGSAPEDVIVEKTLDDMVGLAKEHEERRRKIAMSILSGKLPWLMAANLHREPAYRTWSGRTSERNWILEHHVNISETTLYCSNGFTVIDDGASRHLDAIVSSDQGQAVVADLTALITLQKLNILDIAVDYFGRLHIPADYPFKMFWDSNNLRPHQPSRRTALDALRTALSKSQLHNGSGLAGVELRNVDEHYSDDQAHDGVFHLADILEAIRAAGVATDAQLDRLAAVAHRPPTGSNDILHIHVGDHLRISLSTLSTIHTCEALNIVLQHFHVYVSDEDHQAILGESLWFDSQEVLSADHNALWIFLRDDPRVERISAAESQEVLNDAPRDISFQALEIATELDLPLLADDRCLQAVALNNNPVSPAISFGTAQLLRSMKADGHINIEQYAKAISSLMHWRYRFLLPDPDLFLYWARQSYGSVPGPDLMAVARYHRACLSDPGLFNGLEPTDTPSTVAIKFHQSIESAVGDFVGALWCDETVSKEAAEKFTRWSLDHLLPPPPATMEPQIRSLSDLGMPIFWTIFLLRLAQSSIDGTEVRLRQGIEVAGESLGMSNDEVIRSAMEIIDGIDLRHT